MKCRAFLCLCSLLLPWATSLATSATSEPEYIQGHQIKRLIGSLIEVEGWTGKIPMSNVFYVWNVKSRSSWGITAPTILYLNFVSALRTASGES